MFMGTLAMGVFAVPLAARAQPAGKVPRIGFITSRRRGPGSEAFRQGLREHGWVEGQTIVIEWRYADEGRLDLLPGLAAEVVNLRVDVIVTGSGEPVVLALKQATSTIPIVFAISADPVGSGLVASLARPGGNATGLTSLSPELGGKKLELLKEAVPGASRVAVLWNAAYPGKTLEFKDTQVAARALGVTLQSVEVRRPNDLPGAFSAITRGRPDALVTLTEPLTLAHQRQIVDFAASKRLPMISGSGEFVESGGLLSYGASLRDLFRRAAGYVDKILKGAKPGDLPVEQPTKLELFINLRTARALGLTIPPSLLLRADQVIE